MSCSIGAVILYIISNNVGLGVFTIPISSGSAFSAAVSSSGCQAIINITAGSYAADCSRTNSIKLIETALQAVSVFPLRIS